MPKVSFVMPNRDKESYLNDSIRTILEQDMEDFELIIVDDYSTDSSRDIINSWAKKDKRIVTRFLHDVNLPVAERIDRARNIGNNIAKSPYICVCDSDDMYFSCRAKLSYNALEANPDCGLFYASFLLVDRYGNTKEGMHYIDEAVPFSRERLWDTGKFFIGHPTICYRTELILKHPYNTGGGVGDWGMLYDLIINNNVKVCFSKEPVHVYRVYNNVERRIDKRRNKDMSFEDYILDKKRKKMNREKVLA